MAKPEYRVRGEDRTPEGDTYVEGRVDADGVIHVERVLTVPASPPSTHPSMEPDHDR